MHEIKTSSLAILTLLLSLSTLVCCVLPIIFVSIGLGVVVATIVDYAPFLVIISQYKIYFFIGAVILLIITAWLLWRPNRSCPSDSKAAYLCRRITHWNKRIFWLAIALWLISFIFIYIIAPLWIWLAR